MNTPCQVHECTNDAEVLHTLRERQGWMDYPMEFAVCVPHRDLLSDPETEWMLSNDTTGRVLRVGESLQELNEFVLVEKPTKIKGYAAGRDFSHSAHNGHHIALSVRRRGDVNAQDVTLVVTPGMVGELARLLARVAPAQ